jgi:ferredoxin-NADP reductase
MYTLTIKRIEDIADGTKIFTFDRPLDYTYQAGQYCAIKLANLVEADPKGAARSFSFASSPYESEIAFAMRSGESGYKKTFWTLKPGDTVEVTKAVGFFTEPEGNDQPIVFLVGGIGITPARSILREALHQGSQREYTLFYANRFLKDASFHEEFVELARQLPHFRYVTVLSKSEDPMNPENDERGYITASMLEKYLTDIQNRLYYMVGSGEFIDAMETMLAGFGVMKEQCKKDPFTGLRKPAAK